MTLFINQIWLDVLGPSYTHRFVEKGYWKKKLDTTVPANVPSGNIKITITTGTEDTQITSLGAEVGAEVGAEGGITGVTAKVSTTISASLTLENKITRSKQVEISAPSFTPRQQSRMIVWQRRSELHLERSYKNGPWKTHRKIDVGSEGYYTDVYPPVK